MKKNRPDNKKILQILLDLSRATERGRRDYAQMATFSLFNIAEFYRLGLIKTTDKEIKAILENLLQQLIKQEETAGKPPLFDAKGAIIQ